MIALILLVAGVASVQAIDNVTVTEGQGKTAIYLESM